MSNSFTTNLRLAEPADNDSGWGGTLNGNFAALDGLSPLGMLCVTTTEVPSTTLNVRVTSGDYQQSSGTIANFAGINPRAVTASATNYLWLTDAGVLIVGTGWPSGLHVRLAIVTTTATAIAGITDSRVTAMSGGAATAVIAVTGTANQVTATTTAGTVTLALPAAVTFPGTVTLSGSPTTGLHAATKTYVDTADALAVPKVGGTMTGLLVLSADPAVALGAATKQYSDMKLPLTGGTLTGPLATTGTKVASAAKTADYAVTTSDGQILADATAGPLTVTLPTASTVGGLVIRVLKIDAVANVTVASVSNINGAGTLALSTQWAGKTFVADATSNTWAAY